MTKKDYKLIAKALARSRPPANTWDQRTTAMSVSWRCTYENIANVLADHNLTFDRVKFREACFEERL